MTEFCRVVLVAGPPCSGKSSLAQVLRRVLQLSNVDCALLEADDFEHQEYGFDTDEWKAARGAVVDRLRCLLQPNRTVLVVDTFHLSSMRKQVVQALAASPVACTYLPVVCDAGDDVLMARWRVRSQRVSVPEAKVLDIASRIRREFAPRLAVARCSLVQWERKYYVVVMPLCFGLCELLMMCISGVNVVNPKKVRQVTITRKDILEKRLRWNAAQAVRAGLGGRVVARLKKQVQLDRCSCDADVDRAFGSLVRRSTESVGQNRTLDSENLLDLSGMGEGGIVELVHDS